MISRLSPLAAAGLLVLCGINAWMLAAIIGDDTPEDRGNMATSEQALRLATTSDNFPNSKSINKYSETLAHPVFFKTRLPFVPPPPAPPPPPAKMVTPAPAPIDPGLVLGGVMINRALKRAYLFTKSEPHGTWVTEGESFMGWTVQSIDSTGMRLQQQNRTVELTLYPQH